MRAVDASRVAHLVQRARRVVARIVVVAIGAEIGALSDSQGGRGVTIQIAVVLPGVNDRQDIPPIRERVRSVAATWIEPLEAGDRLTADDRVTAVIADRTGPFQTVGADLIRAHDHDGIETDQKLLLTL